MCFLVKTSGDFISYATREKWKCRYFRSVGNVGYLRILKVKDWRSSAMDIDASRLLVQEARAHRGL
jgi:hypothetical protein